MSKQRTLSFVLVSLFSPLLLIAVVGRILGYYGMGLDILSALAAAGTIELALLAGLQDVIRSWLTAPELTIEVNQPDFQEFYDGEIKVYYSTFRVRNDGGGSAEKVEVVLKRVYRRVGERFKLHDSIPADNLNWSMIGQWVSIPTTNRGGLLYDYEFVPAMYCDYIAPGTSKYCTLGHICEPTHRCRDEYKGGRSGLPASETVLCIEVSFQSNLGYRFLTRGTYGIELQVAASNAKAIMKRFRIEVGGDWPEKEGSTLNEGFKIEEAKYDFDKHKEKMANKKAPPWKPEAGTADKVEAAAETTAGSQQSSANSATPQSTPPNEDKKGKE